MKTKLVLGAVAAAVAVFSQGAFAQAASSPTRAEVKADAKGRQQGSQGRQASTGAATPSKASDTTQAKRARRTTETDEQGRRPADRRRRSREPEGTQPPLRPRPTTAARKAETSTAIKTGDTPTGDAHTRRGRRADAVNVSDPPLRVATLRSQRIGQTEGDSPESPFLCPRGSAQAFRRRAAWRMSPAHRDLRRSLAPLSSWNRSVALSSLVSVA